ncbi:MAG: hypothetical protein NTY15_10575 [Planctomycetota bacterium]|nr:hypothetical protein [Planctomycetota bacterium]
MRTKLATWTRLAVVVVAISGTQTGCKSGWKMPGSDMFPWSKKPSESTLAGSSPSLSMPPSGLTSSPVGPAYKNTPNPLASNAANPGRPSSPYGGTAAPSFNMPPNNASSYAGNQMASNGAGVTSSANGYQTGQYNTASNANRAGGMLPSTPYGAPPSGYSAPAGGAGYSAPPSNAMAGLPNSMPPAYGGMPAGGPTQSPSISSYPPMGGGVSAMPAAYNPGAVANNAPAPSSMPNAYQPPSLPPSTANVAAGAPSYGGAAPYQPGSVGRKTGYDFSPQGAVGGAAPASFPSTANQTNPPPGGIYR